MTYCIVTLFLTLKRVERYGKKKAINCTFFSQLNSSVGSNINRPFYIIFLSQKLSEYMVTTVLFSFEQSKQ